MTEPLFASVVNWEGMSFVSRTCRRGTLDTFSTVMVIRTGLPSSLSVTVSVECSAFVGFVSISSRMMSIRSLVTL